MKFLKQSAIALGAVLIAAASSSAVAQQMDPRTFAVKAAQADIFEIEAAKVVLEKGQSDEVKKFAGDMVKDHSRSSHGLHEAAAKQGVELPSDMGPELSKKLESLKPLSGPTLDAAYVSTQVSVHTEAVELFDKFSKDGEGGALKGFAERTYPAIRMHLIRVRNLNVEH